MAFKTRTQVRDCLKAKIETVKDGFNVYTNKFMTNKALPAIIIESNGSVNDLNSETMRAYAYRFNIYTLTKVENYTIDDSGKGFDAGLDDAQDIVDIKMNEVLNAIQPYCYFGSENSNQILDFTDGNNRIVGLVTEVRAENR